jgi:ADP-ribose pyrophosphatase YjhB (NUDIX family)
MPRRDKKIIPRAKFLSKRVFELIQKSVPIPCADLVILKIKNKKIEVLLIKRKIYPEIGKWCVVGGRVLKGETLAQTINRQAKNELGILVSIIPPWDANHPLRVFDNIDFDPQKHPILLSYPVIIKSGKPAPSGPEFSESKWFPADKLPEIMGFRHREEVKVVLKALTQ